MMRPRSAVVILLLGVLLKPSGIKAENTIASPRHPVIILPNYYPMPFDNELAAAISAARQHNPTSIREDREFIGGIFKDLSRPLFYYSAFAGKRGEDQISATLTYPKHLQLVAVWHTHGAGKGVRQYFSEQDIRLAEQLQLPIYLADSSGFLKRFSPGDPVMRKYRGKKGSMSVRHAEGEYIRSATGNKLKISVEGF